MNHPLPGKIYKLGKSFFKWCSVLSLAGVFLLVSGIPAADITPEQQKAADAYLAAHFADQFTTKDVIRLLGLKVDSDSLIKEIAFRLSKDIDLKFSVTDADVDQLKRAGASNDLIDALRSPISAARYVRAHGPVRITPPDGGYSVDYPIQPEKKDVAEKDFHGATYIAKAGNVTYTSGHGAYDHDIVDANRELQEEAGGLAKLMNGKLVKSTLTRFVRSPGDELPALEGTVENDKFVGRFISIVDGRRTYSVGAFVVKPYNGQTETDRFLKSFKLVPSATGAPVAVAQQSPTKSPAETPAASPADEKGTETQQQQASLVSLLAGAYVVKRPNEWGEYQSSFNLLDERLSSKWATDRGVISPQTIVIALPEKTLLKTLEFSNGSVDAQFTGCGAKDISVEMSDTSESDGFQKIADVSLKEREDNQQFPVSAEIPGRWVRLIVKNNHSSDPDNTIELTEFRAFGTQLTHTPLPEVTGTYSGEDYTGPVHIKQEGTSVAGCYEARQGQFDGGLDGRVATLSWHDNTGGEGGPGTAIIVFSPDRKQLFSLWWGPYDTSYGKLSLGERKSDEVGSCPQWPSAEKKVDPVEEQMTKDLEEFGRVRVYAIHFDTDMDVIKEESKPTLDKIVAILKAKPDWKITIEGHTDSISTPQHNQGLSERRASSVKNYLTTEGIDESRLTSVGYGQTRPVADNDSPIGRAQNRRVELGKL